MNSKIQSAYVRWRIRIRILYVEWMVNPKEPMCAIGRHKLFTPPNLLLHNEWENGARLACIRPFGMHK